MSNGMNPSPQSSGMPTWLKFLLGCGCAVLVLVIAFFVATAMGVSWLAKKAEENPGALAELLAEKVIDADPNLEVVKSGDGKMTIRDVRTGKEATYDYSDIAAGNFRIEGENGEVVTITGEGGEQGGLTITGKDGSTTTLGAATDLAGLPSWVLIYPNREEVQAGFRANQGDVASGLLTIVTTDDFETVKSWYESQMKEQGFEVSGNVLSFGTTQGAVLAGQKGETTLNASLSAEKGKVTIALQYNGKP